MSVTIPLVTIYKRADICLRDGPVTAGFLSSDSILSCIRSSLDIRGGLRIKIVPSTARTVRDIDEIQVESISVSSTIYPISPAAADGMWGADIELEGTAR
jgi:hypothetical protein